MIPERRYLRILLCRTIILNSGRVEVKADGDLKIKVRFDDGTTENREYNLEYLRQYVDHLHSILKTGYWVNMIFGA